MSSGGRININMSCYQYRKSQCGDKTILRPSYLHNGVSYTDKMTYLYWVRALVNVARPRRWLAITRANVNSVLYRHIASLSHNEYITVHLSHWNRNKMAILFDHIFKCIFLEENTICIWFTFRWCLSWAAIFYKPEIGRVMAWYWLADNN